MRAFRFTNDTTQMTKTILIREVGILQTQGETKKKYKHLW